MDPGEVIRPQDRVALFVDAANAEQAAEHLGFEIDWAKVRDLFVADGTYAGGYFYTARREGDGGQQGFLDEIASKGYIVRTKPEKVIRDGARAIRKGNLDVELVLDMVAAEPTYDVAVLFSGDSDFRRLVEMLQHRGKRVYVVASQASLSRELLHAAHKPVFHLEDLKDRLAWTS